MIGTDEHLSGGCFPHVILGGAADGPVDSVIKKTSKFSEISHCPIQAPSQAPSNSPH